MNRAREGLLRTFGLAIGLMVVMTPGALLAAPASEASDVVVRDVPDGGSPLVARILSDGTIHLLYAVNNHPMYAESKDAGATFTAGVPVVVDPPDRRLTYTGEDMAVTESGRVFVVLSTDAWKLKLPQEQWGLHLAIRDAGKDAFAPIRNVNRMPSSGYSVAVADENHVTLTWFSKTLYMSTSQDGGVTFTPNTIIDPAYSVCECCTTRATYNANGELAIMYREKTDNHRDMYLVRLQKDGTHARTRLSRILWDVAACPMTYWDIRPSGEGYIAAWPTRGKLYFNRLNAQGEPGAREVMTDATMSLRSQPLALTNAQNFALIAWREQGRLHWQIYDAQNRPAAAPANAPGTGAAAAGVVEKSGRFVLFR